MNVYDTVDDLFFSNAFDLVPVAEVHAYWVAGGGYVDREAFDFGEGGLEAVPLGLILFAPLGLGKGVSKNGIILVVVSVACWQGELMRPPYFPERQLLQRRPAGEEL